MPRDEVTPEHRPGRAVLRRAPIDELHLVLLMKDILKTLQR